MAPLCAPAGLVEDASLTTLSAYRGSVCGYDEHAPSRTSQAQSTRTAGGLANSCCGDWTARSVRIRYLLFVHATRGAPSATTGDECAGVAVHWYASRLVASARGWSRSRAREPIMNERLLWLIRDARRARRMGSAELKKRQRGRLAEMVAFARTNSAYYRELYRDVPARVEEPTLLPVTNKKALMARFDDWVTDRAVSIDKVRAFVGNLELIGERFLGKYTVATTSGTTGTPGIFLLDDRALAVTNALVLRMVGAWLGISDIVRIVARGARATMICATVGHYAEVVAGTRLRKRSPRRAKKTQILSAHIPLPELVAKLNEFRPAILAPYAGIGAQLANEQEAGRLHIDPALVVLSAEGLSPAGYDRITTTFGVTTRHSYAATECTFISYSCDYHWLHVNSDWVVLEPVDENNRPVAPGEQSHTVLVSNLANRVQPILRHDIGDRVTERPDPCPCGNPLPAIRVHGRTADVLTFPTERGERVSIPALMFEVADTAGIEQFQIVQTTPTTLRLRLRLATGADSERAWQGASSEIRRLLRERQLEHIRVERADEPPEQSVGGKYREIVPLS